MDQSGELELQWDIVENQEDISSSLEEIYGYEVFSEKFYNETKSIKAEQELEEENNFNSVMYGEAKDETEAAFQRVMSAEVQTMVKNEYKEIETGTMNNFFAAGFLVIGMVVAGSVFFIIDRWKKGRG